MKKKRLSVVLMLSVFLVFTACTSVDKNVLIKDRKISCDSVRIAVFPFKDAPGQEGSGTIVADGITTQMINVGNWSLVERSQLQLVMKEKSLDATGLTTADYGEIGKLANIDYLVIGSVSQYHYGRQALIVVKTKLAFQGRIIDVKNGSIAGTFNYDLETGKNAWLGCCLCGWYYLPVLLLTDQNISNDVNRASRDIVEEIRTKIRISRKREKCQ